jgi:hypothetical protein
MQMNHTTQPTLWPYATATNAPVVLPQRTPMPHHNGYIPVQDAMLYLNEIPPPPLPVGYFTSPVSHTLPNLQPAPPMPVVVPQHASPVGHPVANAKPLPKKQENSATAVLPWVLLASGVIAGGYATYRHWPELESWGKGLFSKKAEVTPPTSETKASPTATTSSGYYGGGASSSTSSTTTSSSTTWATASTTSAPTAKTSTPITLATKKTTGDRFKEALGLGIIGSMLAGLATGFVVMTKGLDGASFKEGVERNLHNFVEKTADHLPELPFLREDPFANKEPIRTPAPADDITDPMDIVSQINNSRIELSKDGALSMDDINQVENVSKGRIQNNLGMFINHRLLVPFSGVQELQGLKFSKDNPVRAIHMNSVFTPANLVLDHGPFFNDTGDTRIRTNGRLDPTKLLNLVISTYINPDHVVNQEYAKAQTVVDNYNAKGIPVVISLGNPDEIAAKLPEDITLPKGFTQTNLSKLKGTVNVSSENNLITNPSLSEARVDFVLPVDDSATAGKQLTEILATLIKQHNLTSDEAIRYVQKLSTAASNNGANYYKFNPNDEDVVRQLKHLNPELLEKN